ncbi:DNA-binding transcriptional regulator, IclR family [Gordonia malaquae]|uniref:Putative IclR family transcriptional regulator n=1 Tax=Gordonia malaquae NBRC 108250 TaxID=1223542 RepID=M3UL76_GORML|nr:IclR family transcriptional regulator [Gordonia malaquae]GAC80445.1 putative IclR family transcriptional regulator [Gordonia malaquae NBRC 108250]SEE13955.1 DNA-binding transcriptional regulator, IclR family [Gordonia malaquae]
MASTDKSGQGVARIAALLRAIGSSSAATSTTALAAAAGLARPTAHRLLTALAAEGLVDRDNRTGDWSLGPELYLLGATAAAAYDIRDDAQSVLDRLAGESGESVFLSARRGDETVCVAGQEGSFPVRSHVLYEGIRFPLGVASAGLAILSHLPDRDIDDYLQRSDLGATWGPEHAHDMIRRRIARTRLDGYATNPALLVEASWGMGAAVFDSDGRPAWALSLTGVEARFQPERRTELGRLLLAQAHELTRKLQVRRKSSTRLS